MNFCTWMEKICVMLVRDNWGQAIFILAFRQGAISTTLEEFRVLVWATKTDLFKEWTKLAWYCDA